MTQHLAQQPRYKKTGNSGWIHLYRPYFGSRTSSHQSDIPEPSMHSWRAVWTDLLIIRTLSYPCRSSVHGWSRRSLTLNSPHQTPWSWADQKSWDHYWCPWQITDGHGQMLPSTSSWSAWCVSHLGSGPLWSVIPFSDDSGLHHSTFLFRPPILGYRLISSAWQIYCVGAIFNVSVDIVDEIRKVMQVDEGDSCQMG